MEIMESIRAAFEELIVPELDRIKKENREITAIEVTNKRLDDVIRHLTSQSRRIDAVRAEALCDYRDQQTAGAALRGDRTAG